MQRFTLVTNIIQCVQYKFCLKIPVIIKKLTGTDKAGTWAAVQDEEGDGTLAVDNDAAAVLEETAGYLSRHSVDAYHQKVVTVTPAVPAVAQADQPMNPEGSG